MQTVARANCKMAAPTVAHAQMATPEVTAVSHVIIQINMIVWVGGCSRQLLILFKSLNQL